MSWLRNLTTPRVKAANASKSKDNLWTKCPSCEKLLYTKDLENMMYVCDSCHYHFRFPAHKWRDAILDQDYNVTALDTIRVLDDPISFRDSKKYKDRLHDARNKTGKIDVATTYYGRINNKPAVLFIMDFEFMGGSMGLSVGKTFSHAIEIAIDKKAAFITFTASGGARMQEGMLSLMQMPSTVASICFLREQSLPFINVFTNPTTGGVLASFATIGDIHIAEPKSLIGFAGARVIENTIKQKLPENFQRSEFLMDHGLIDAVVPRQEMKQTISNYLNYLLP